VRGKHIKVCRAGLHFYWPLVSQWAEYPTARQTDRLESQVMESKDSKTFLVSGTLTYSVDDLSLLLPRVAFATRNTVDLAMTALHDVCCDFDWAELQAEQRKGTLKTKLRNEAQRQLGEYGIRVHKLQLNSLARCRVLRISQATSQEEN
jgi:regulator of protease activity HflC (stomatin/prohibitin superfamily)